VDSQPIFVDIKSVAVFSRSSAVDIESFSVFSHKFFVDKESFIVFEDLFVVDSEVSAVFKKHSAVDKYSLEELNFICPVELGRNINNEKKACQAICYN
jgi:hypothetical protein